MTRRREPADHPPNEPDAAARPSPDASPAAGSPPAESPTAESSTAGAVGRRAGSRRRELGTAVLVLVVLVAAIVALWPRGQENPSPAGQGGSSFAIPAPGTADLAAARAAAALRPCPAPTTAPGAPAVPALAGIAASCLGTGAPLDLGAVLAGRPALINVWASWCGPCREELPALDAYAARPGAIPVLGVQVQSAPADGLALLHRLGVRFPSVVDADGAVQHALRAPSVLPVSYLLFPDGRVTRVTDPAVFTSPDQVANTVRSTLGVGG